MWIERTSKGLRMCERYVGLDGKTHRACVTLARDTAQARRRAQEELQRIISHKSTLGDVIALNRLVELYLDSRELKPSTRLNYESAFRQIVDILGDLTTASLTAPQALRRLSESKKAQSTLNRYIVLLNGLLAWSYDFGYMSEKVHIRSFKEKQIKSDASENYLEADELSDVLHQLEGSMAYYVSRFLVLTGCRIGEASALTWDDIDDRYVHITKAWKRENGTSTPKTAHSVRDIFIQPELRTFLREYRKYRLIHMTAYGIRTELLFFSDVGTHYESHHLIRALQRVSCEKHLHPHIFRHTHTALLAEQGMSLDAISRRLGHSNSNITKEIYFHVTEKLKARDEEAMSRVTICP